MLKQLNKAIFMLLAITIISISSIISYADDVEDNAYENVLKKIVEEDMLNFDSGHKLDIFRKIELFDYDDNVIAEYLEFGKDNALLGYVIIGKQNGKIYDYSSDGLLFASLLSKSGLTYDDLQNCKVYFSGVFEIFIKNENGDIIDLMPKNGVYPNEISNVKLGQVFKKKTETIQNYNSQEEFLNKKVKLFCLNLIYLLLQ